MKDMFRVGVIANTHGIKGEVKVFPTTEDATRFTDLKKVFLDTKSGMQSMTITGVRYFKNMVIVKFKGINDINDIEKYKGCDLYVSREDALPLEEDEYYIGDILDAKVVDDTGEELGVLTDVLQTGANDVYVVECTDGKEVLFPVTKECVLDIDTDQKLVTVHVLPGLMD